MGKQFQTVPQMYLREFSNSGDYLDKESEPRKHSRTQSLEECKRCINLWEDSGCKDVGYDSAHVFHADPESECCTCKRDPMGDFGPNQRVIICTSQGDARAYDGYHGRTGKWSDKEQMWRVNLDEDGARYGLCCSCHDARRTNPDYDLCAKCEHQAEISGAGFGSGQHTFCRPEDMERIPEITVADTTPTKEINLSDTTLDTPAESNNLPVVTPAEPTKEADATHAQLRYFAHASWGELRHFILTRPGAIVKRALFKMPWDELKKFAKAHHMNSRSFAKFRHGGDKNGFVHEIMTHIHYSFANVVADLRESGEL